MLERLNIEGELTLRGRREVIPRVVDFSIFETCWPDHQLKAKCLVASIREVVKQKDAFTCMNNAREDERQARLADVQKLANEKRDRTLKIAAAKGELYALFGAAISPKHVVGGWKPRLTTSFTLTKFLFAKLSPRERGRRGSCRAD